MPNASSGPLRLGLLGCGRIAHIFHLPILAQMRGVELAAVAEPDADARAAASRGARGAIVVDDWRDVVADPGIDGVVVCLPSAMHADAACAAFAAGRHVYLEKPIATTLEDGRRLLDAWRSGVEAVAGDLRRRTSRTASAASRSCSPRRSRRGPAARWRPPRPSAPRSRRSPPGGAARRRFAPPSAPAG